MTTRLIQLIPGIEADELMFLETMTKDLSDEQLQTFAILYNNERKKPDMILIGGIIGLLGIGGVQRFMIGQIGMGILYLLTAGLCYIGTIIDLVNYKKLTFEFNRELAAKIVRGAIQ
jgi:TM2 domain-containing membrane protein YozV